MTVHLPTTQIPTGATVDIHVHVSAPLNITPYVARQKVSALAKMEISVLTRADSPELVVGERLLWSVPVVLGFPDRGIVGKVGEILVDVTTGKSLVDEDTKRRMVENVHRLADSTPL